MASAETPLKPSVLLLVRNLAIAVGCGVGGYYLVQTEETVLIIIGACLLFTAPLMLALPLFMGLPGRGPCPDCGGTIETMGSRDTNLLCRGCNAYLDAGQGKLRHSDPQRIEAQPTFSAPSPWSDITNVVYSTIAFSASDVISDAFTTRGGGTRLLEARWPAACVVCGGAPTRRDAMTREISKPGNIVDTKIMLAAKDIPYCGQHKEGVIFERVDSATPGASGCFGLKFRSLAQRNAFMRANPWKFTWHQ
jgi:hypothetical protein